MVKSDISRFFIALCNKGEGFSRKRYQLGSRKWAFEFSTETVDKFVENSLINGLTARSQSLFNTSPAFASTIFLHCFSISYKQTPAPTKRPAPSHPPAQDRP
ncbi:MAG: hypothetical protein IK051_00290 [Rhodocyclaceae bacterium]|nr:hypothetical protein [Rhodocyclaceae bacterium]